MPTTSTTTFTLIFPAPTLASDLDASQFSVGGDVGDFVGQINPTTVWVDVPNDHSGQPWFTTDAFAPGWPALHGPFLAALPVAQDVAQLGTKQIIVQVNIDATAVTIDPSKVKIDGLPADAILLHGVGFFEATASAWPNNPSGHTADIEVGWAPAGTIPFVGTCD